MECGSLDPSTEPRGRKTQRRLAPGNTTEQLVSSFLLAAHTHTWPGLELPGLMASHWHLLPVSSVGLAVTVDALSTTVKAL